MQDYEKLGVFYLGREYDAAAGKVADPLILYDSKDLTTHGVIVGMTGSGKTGLALALLEEAAIDGIPAICIDPKGDLGNLLLAFPNLAPADFVPWVDPAEAQRKGLQVDQFAAQTAQKWREGLAQWQQQPERIARFRDAVDVTIYTPGSESGLPLSVLRSFAAPAPEVMSDSSALRDRVGSVVSGLLSLLGRDADPLQGREHILLANVIEQSWRRGQGLDMASLIAAVQKPPFDKVGAFDLETFFPAKERTGLAMAINNLLASPGFAAWMLGEPLDAQRLLYTPEGKPRISVLSIAHLSDPERMFIVTLVLNELIAWMRTQSGTSSLRALFYMDEIFGYFPPTANPPSKPPMLTLLKQARAFGLGCVLATQNPVDLDYKGLSNAGTWWIGRLQTERDKARVIDGLESAIGGDAGFDRSTIEKLVSGLTQRVFLMRNVHEDHPVLMQSRWALSYLRGPLTSPEISRLMAQKKSQVRRDSPAAGAAGADAPADAARRATAAVDATAGRPAVPPDVREHFLAARGREPVTYEPRIMGTAKLHFVDAKTKFDQWQTTAFVAPLSDDGKTVLWAEGSAQPDLLPRLEKEPVEGSSFGELPGPALRAASYATWGRQLAAHLYETARADLFVCDPLGTTSQVGETEGDFRARLALMAREQRDAAAEGVKRKYASKFATLEQRLRAAQQRADREREQVKNQALSAAVQVGSSILGALLGRRKLSATNIGRAASAVRAGSRVLTEQGDVGRADETLEAVQQQQKELQAQFDADVAAIDRTFDAGNTPLRRVQVSPRKSDVAVGEVALVWVPYRRGSDGFLAPASE